MRRFVLATCLVGSWCFGCSRPSSERVADAGSPPPEVEVAGTPLGDLIVGDPISHANMTIFPISSKMPRTADRFITLDEGLAAGTVTFIEIGVEDGERNVADAANSFGADDPFASAAQETEEQAANEAHEDVVQEANDPFANPFGEEQVDGDVNKLMVLNTSGKLLYLMPGEVISGGKQDRTIGQEVVIASSETPVPIEVFCVERGRWGGRSMSSTVSQLAAAGEFEQGLSLVVSQTATVEELAKEAQRGKFVVSVGQVNKDVRLAVQQAGVQGRVWEEVDKTNSKVGNNSDSDNFAGNYLSDEVANDLSPFIEMLKSAGETKQIVGVAVAVNGKMLSIDIFESTPLFKKFWPKLLKSYALDAVAAMSDGAPKENSNAISVEDCIAFMEDVGNSKLETIASADGQKITKRKSSLGTSFSYYNAEAADLMGVAEDDETAGFGGAFGGGVHTSVLAH